MKTEEIIKRTTETLMQIACESQLFAFSGDESAGNSVKELFEEVLNIWLGDVTIDDSYRELIKLIAFEDVSRDKRTEILFKVLLEIVTPKHENNTLIGYQQWLDGKFVEEDEV